MPKQPVRQRWFCGPSWPRLLVGALLMLSAFVALGGRPSTARGDEGITIVSSEAAVHFPAAVTFELVASSASPITFVSLVVNTPGKAYGAVPLERRPAFNPGNAVRATWSWENPGPGLNVPPGAEISYRWIIRNEAGSSVESAPATVRFTDGRFSWRQAEGRGIRLYWYAGDQALGSKLLQTAEDGLQKLRDEQGVDLKSDVSVYIYPTQQALRGAMLGSPSWIGGRSYPDYATILLVVENGDLKEGERSLVHELTHQLVYQQTFDPLLGSHVPLWLNEGLAVTSEGPTTPEFEAALSRATRQNRVASFRLLDGQFPYDADASTRAYAQSESFVRYLLSKHGADGMRSLLNALQRGNRIDAALEQAYGSNLDRLQDDWRASVGAQPLSSGAEAASNDSRSVATREGQRVSLQGSGRIDAVFAGFAVLAVALVAGMAILLRRLRACD